LVVIPDFTLANLPLELLLTQAPQKATYLPTDDHSYADAFLLHRHVFFYSPTANLLKATNGRARADGDVLVLANPFAGHHEPSDKELLLRFRTGWSFDPLPFAEVEAERIRRVRKRTEILKRGSANESLFLQEASQHRILHFATHAFVDTTFDAFSGLILAASPDSADDGILMGYEISNLDLNCDLVVLSACETGRGKLVHGEGVLGLPRQFLAAGAGSVLMTLWKVDDKLTSELMPAFYENLFNRRRSKAEALTEAKLTLLKQPIQPNGMHYQHPLFWAAFVLFGDPGFDVQASAKGLDFGIALWLLFTSGVVAIAAYWFLRSKIRTAARREGV